MAKFKWKGEEYYIDNILKGVLDNELRDVTRDDDLPIVILGKERSGKTVLARDTICPYVAYKLHTKFGIDNINFTASEYMDFSLNAPQYTPILLDESRRDLGRSKRGGIKEMFNDFMSECGDQNQIHVLVLPDYTSLDRDLAKRRLKVLIEVVKSKHPNTGKTMRFFKLIKTGNFNKLDYYWEKRIPSFKSNMVFTIGQFKLQGEKLVDEYKKKKMMFKKQKYLSQMKKNADKFDPKLVEARIVHQIRSTGLSWAKIQNLTAIPSTNCRRLVEKWEKHLVKP